MGIIEAIASVVHAATGLLGPWLSERRAQRYREEMAAGLRRWRDTLESRNPVRIHRAVRQLLMEVGQPIADVDDQPATIAVPVEYLDELVQCAYRLRCLDRQLASLEEALKRR